MSKKTRKEKIAADLRRQEQVKYQFNNTSYSSTGPQTPETTPAKKVFALNVPTQNVTSTGQNNYAYVWSDLTRILVLTVLAICAQGVLWYFLGNKI